MVQVSFKLYDERTVGFQVGDHDPRHTLRIDPTYQWHTFYGSSQSDVGLASVVHSSGNMYITGYSGGSWLGDNDTPPKHAFSTPSYDCFVLKLDSNGGYQWHTFYGSSSNDYAYGLSTDRFRNVYVTGDCDDTWLGDGSAAPRHAHSGKRDVCLLKLNPEGAYLWHTFYGSGSEEYSYGITVDGAGSIYASGFTNNTFWNLSTPLHTGGGWNDIYALKLAEPCFFPPAGMVSWWRAENNANDVFGINNGTLRNGAGFGAGAVVQAFVFDGVDDYVEIANAANLNPANVTLDAWVNPVTTTNGSRIISKDISAASCASPFITYQLEIRGDAGSKAHLAFTTSDNVLHEVLGTSAIPTGTFSHIAATFDGSTAKIYVNGVLENSLPVTGVLQTSGTPVIIGNAGAACRSSYSGQVEFNGTIDEVEIFDRALSASEIAAIYNAGSSGKCVPDLTPNTFTFTDVTNAERNTLYESNAITVSGIDYATPFSITGGEYSVSTDGGGTWSSYSATVPSAVLLNHQVKVRVLSSASFSGTRNGVLAIGGISDTFSVTTKPALLYLPLIRRQ